MKKNNIIKGALYLLAVVWVSAVMLAALISHGLQYYIPGPISMVIGQFYTKNFTADFKK